MPSKASASPNKKRKAAEAAAEAAAKADTPVLPVERLRELATATTATAEEPDARPEEEEPDAGTWRCPKGDCNHRNKANKARCFMCLAWRPKSPSKKRKKGAKSAAKKAKAPPPWQCHKCSHQNAGEKARCSSCQAWKGGRRDGFTPSNKKEKGVSSGAPKKTKKKKGPAKKKKGAVPVPVPAPKAPQPFFPTQAGAEYYEGTEAQRGALYKLAMQWHEYQRGMAGYLWNWERYLNAKDGGNVSGLMMMGGVGGGVPLPRHPLPVHLQPGMVPQAQLAAGKAAMAYPPKGRRLSEFAKSANNPWTERDDDIIRKTVLAHPNPAAFQQWSALAKESLPGRAPKQIRDRWKNQLDPQLDHSPFSRDDDLLLWESYKEHGSRWREISEQAFKGKRSENAVKNKWNSAAFRRWVAEEHGEGAHDSAVAEARVRAQEEEAGRKPCAKRTAFTRKEDDMLLRGYMECSGRWAMISTEVFGSTRSETTLKNRFYAQAFVASVTAHAYKDALRFVQELAASKEAENRIAGSLKGSEEKTDADEKELSV